MFKHKSTRINSDPKLSSFRHNFHYKSVVKCYFPRNLRKQHSAGKILLVDRGKVNSNLHVYHCPSRERWVFILRSKISDLDLMLHSHSRNASTYRLWVSVTPADAFEGYCYLLSFLTFALGNGCAEMEWNTSTIVLFEGIWTPNRPIFLW